MNFKSQMKVITPYHNSLSIELHILEGSLLLDRAGGWWSGDSHEWLTYCVPRICHSFMTSSLGCLLSLWQVGALVVRCLSESRPKLFNIFGSIIPKLIINKCLAIHSFPGIRGRIPFDSSILYRNTGMWTRFLFHYFVTYLSRWQYKSEYLPATLLAKTWFIARLYWQRFMSAWCSLNNPPPSQRSITLKLISPSSASAVKLSRFKYIKRIHKNKI